VPDTVQLSTHSVETITSGSNPLIRFSTQYAEAITSGSNPLIRLSAQYLEVIAALPPPPFASVGTVGAGATVSGVGAGGVSTTVSSRGAAAGQADVAGTTPSAAAAGEVDVGATVSGVGAALATGAAAGEVDAYATVSGAGARIVTPGLQPSLPGLGWPVHRRPTFDTIIAPHSSGSEVRAALWANALWEFELTYDALSGDSVNYPGAGSLSYQTLLGFYLARGGQSGTFLFLDPDFNTATNQAIAVGDGATLAFPFIRSIGGVIEPVSFVTNVNSVTLDGAPATGWAPLAPAMLTFAAPPANGALIAATFNYAFTCRFLEDSIDFEEFMLNLWSMKSLKFRQVRL
jgi:hypothetical protein